MSTHHTDPSEQDSDAPVASLSNHQMLSSVTSLPAALPSQKDHTSPSGYDSTPTSPDKGHHLARAPTTASVASTASASVKSVSASWQVEFEKRFKHQLPSPAVPEDMTVIQTQSADLQASILIHGRLYLTRTHLCFRANILGAVTEKIHPLKEVSSVEKGTTAKWIQNAVYINQAVVDKDGEEVDKHYGYGSMANRDTMYADLIENWKREAPARHDAFMAKRQAEEGESGDEQTEGEDGERPETPRGEGSKANTVAFVEPEASNTATRGGGSPSSPSSSATTAVKETRGSGERLKELAINAKLNLSLQQAYELLYKNDAFTKHFYEVEKKLTELEITPWTKEGGKEERKLTYVMHMSNPIGPSQSSCWGTETVVVSDPAESFEIESETHTPDVPSGKSFHVHTRTCLSHTSISGRPATRVHSTTQVEWTASSWLKGTITPAVVKGQKEHYKQLVDSARKWVKEHPDDFGDAGIAVDGADAEDEDEVEEEEEEEEEQLKSETVAAKGTTTSTSNEKGSSATAKTTTSRVPSKSNSKTDNAQTVPQQAVHAVEQVAEGFLNPATIVLLVLCALLVYLQYKGYARGWFSGGRGGGGKVKLGPKEVRVVVARVKELEARVRELEQELRTLRGMRQ